MLAILKKSIQASFAVTLDQRGNKWHRVHMLPSQIKKLERIRAKWTRVTEDEIRDAKQTTLESFWKSDEAQIDSPDNVKGMACSNFIYLFNDNHTRHYFVCTSGNHQNTALRCDAECDMHWASHASFDCVLAQQGL